MNVAALLQDSPSDEGNGQRGRSGSSAGGAPPPSAPPPPSQSPQLERESWNRGPRPPQPSSNAGIRSLVHSPNDTRPSVAQPYSSSNIAQDNYRGGPPPHLQSPPPSSHMHHRGPTPLSPIMPMKDSKSNTSVNTSPSSSRLTGPQGFSTPHGHAPPHSHSSHPSPAMASLRPNTTLSSSNTSSTKAVHSGNMTNTGQMGVNSGGEEGLSSAPGWPGPGYGGGVRERRSSASSGIGGGGGLLRSSEWSNQHHHHHQLERAFPSGQLPLQHQSHPGSPAYDKEYHQVQQQQPAARRKTVSSGSGPPFGVGSAPNTNSMPPPSQLSGPGTGTPPGALFFWILTRNMFFFARCLSSACLFVAAIIWHFLPMHSNVF